MTGTDPSVESAWLCAPDKPSPMSFERTAQRPQVSSATKVQMSQRGIIQGSRAAVVHLYSGSCRIQTFRRFSCNKFLPRSHAEPEASRAKRYWRDSRTSLDSGHCRPVMNDATQILNAASEGEENRSDQLLTLLYEELRKLAGAKLAREQGGQTLQATALVHEAWLRLNTPGSQNLWQNRAHFFAAASEAMRRILIDRARSKQAQRRGGGRQRVDFDEIEIPEHAGDDVLLSVNEAVELLAAEDPRIAELVKLRFFAGLSVEEAAAILGVTDRTARRYWRFARAWLRERLQAKASPGAESN